MSKRLKQKIESSKLYAPNWLSLTHNNDLSHEKLWNQKVEEGKHIQEQKQIDRILFGIVKERLFGQLLSQDTRISNQGYYALDRLNKELVNPTVVKGSRMIMPLSSQPAYDIVARSRLKHRTLDAGDSRATRSFHRRSNNQSSQLRMSKLPSQQNPLSKTKRFFFPKQISASKLPNLAAHFRELTNSPTTMLYDIKLSKEMLIKYNKSKEIVSPFCLDKLLYFFNFTGPYNIKLYGTWVESVFNCTMGESSFAIFQVLDQSRNGFLTVTDIFQALQDFPMSSSSQVEKQIYDLMQRIKQTREPQSPQPKLSVQQIIVRNHTLKLQQMRDLVKESSKELISTDTFKSTTYHKSMYALEHTAASREKNSQLEYSQGNSSKGFERVKKRAPVREEGLRFGDYANIFSTRRSEFFLLFARLLLGEDASVLLQ